MAAFQQTQLQAELSRCKQVLLERGASNTFDLGAQSRPAGVPAAPACAADLCSALPLKLISLQSRTSPQRLHHSSLRLMQLLPLDAAPHPPLPPSSPPAFRRPPLRSLRASTTAGSERLLRASRAGSSLSATKLQSELTRSLEATAWFELFSGCGRYKQAILTALTLNSPSSAWLSPPPLSIQPAYRLRDDDYVQAVRHRLGLLPYDNLRDALCVNCADRNLETLALLIDPDHVHSCKLQQGSTVRRRHDAIKLALAELARSCGCHV